MNSVNNKFSTKSGSHVQVQGHLNATGAKPTPITPNKLTSENNKTPKSFFSIPILTSQPKQQQTTNNHVNNNSQINSISTSNSVKFNENQNAEQIYDREKYLTAKYPNHQMALIKKRLKVEFWIDDRLKVLFNINVSVKCRFGSKSNCIVNWF
jgi:hypothetical protein